jgi:hypothetical protein
MPRKACKQVIHIYGFDVELDPVSSLTLRGRPPFFPAWAAISRRRSGESFRARALPPIRANSVIESLFMHQMYHGYRRQSSSAQQFPRAFSLIVEFYSPAIRTTIEREEIAITRTSASELVLTDRALADSTAAGHPPSHGATDCTLGFSSALPVPIR